jgi:aminoglycoside phosphotransferase family enzyme/predicted kinase
LETCIPVPDFVQLMHLLAEPATYPHPVEAVRTVQTHISCVFLTGDYAYKVKKPVDFGFLDYRTLSTRHHYCVQELRLNRRLCPDIYLDVLPITFEDGRLQMGGNGTPVEWAVRMKQLRDEDMLSQRLRAGALTPGEILSLAGRLSAFHRSAPSNAAIRAYGAHGAIADTVAVTLKTMDTVAQEPHDALTRRILRSSLEEFMQAHADLFACRMKEGRIRDCHGDLRTQNICLDTRYDEGIQIFDCIEFNDAFRYIDVAADIAYLAMDLDLAGRADVSMDLMDTYLRETEDRSLAQILPFYLIYRAIVRGNIALLASRESEIPEPERQTQRSIAARAHDLASSYAQRRPRPALIITVGFSGSGKSVLAAELACRLPAVCLSSDRLRKTAAGVSAGTRLETGNYTAYRRAEVYQMMRTCACDYLRRGQHVILDATFLEAHEREAAANLARDHDAEFWVLECQAPDALIRQRLQTRRTDSHASDADLRVYEQQRYDSARSGPVAPSDAAPLHSIHADTSRPVAETAHRIMERFNTKSLCDIETKRGNSWPGTEREENAHSGPAYSLGGLPSRTPFPFISATEKKS